MKRSLAVIIIILLTLPLAVLAQDATPTLPPEGQPVEGLPTEELPPAEGEPNLESVTSDPASYYGQEVTFEGVVTELVNVRSFVLGEGAALDDDQVLVLNNSGHEFSLELTRDARVRVTGTIYPAWDQGGWDQVMTLPMGGMTDQPMGEMQVTPVGEEMMTEEAGTTTDTEMSTEEPMMEPTPVSLEGDMVMPGVTLASYPTAVFEERFPSHTLLVIDSVDDITFVEPVEAQ